MMVKEIVFPQDTAHRKSWFKAASFLHPAKMNLGLQIYLIEHYTKVGDWILDPMAGSGSILVATAIGRNVICVELEEKFCVMMRQNWEKIKAQGPMLGYPMGTATILQDDSRNLDGLLATHCIFSPPYAETEVAADPNFDYKRNGKKDWGKSMSEKIDNPSNIGNLPYGQIDKVVFSPPYAGSVIAADGEFYKKKAIDTGRNPNGTHVKGASEGIDNPNNISNLPYGSISTILTSPPHQDILSKGHKSKLGDIKKQGSSYFSGKVDVACFSPPYEAQLQGSGADAARKRIKEGKYKGLRPDVWISKTNIAGSTFGDGYSKAKDNIGNLKGESYLSAMKIVYENCFSILRDGGLLILVTKNFIRAKKIIQLDLDTIKICEQCGFVLKERLKRKLKQQSFWRTLQLNKCDYRCGKKCKLGLVCPTKKKEYAKYLFDLGTPIEHITEKLCNEYVNTTPRLDFEDVLIFEKI